jgi:hypothetical protein
MKENKEWPETPSEAVNSLKHIAADHPCCAVTINAIIAWFENTEKQSGERPPCLRCGRCGFIEDSDMNLAGICDECNGAGCATAIP